MRVWSRTCGVRQLVVAVQRQRPVEVSRQQVLEDVRPGHHAVGQSEPVRSPHPLARFGDLRRGEPAAVLDPHAGKPRLEQLEGHPPVFASVLDDLVARVRIGTQLGWIVAVEQDAGEGPGRVDGAAVQLDRQAYAMSRGELDQLGQVLAGACHARRRRTWPVDGRTSSPAGSARLRPARRRRTPCRPGTPPDW